MFIRIIFILFITIIFSNCSAYYSALEARSQTVMLKTPLVEGAQCTVKDQRGNRWYLYQTPGSLTIKNGHAPLIVTCTKTGYKKTVVEFDDDRMYMMTVNKKRIEPEFSTDFASATPKLVPGILDEATGFVLDPYRDLSTKYPYEIAVWMEPKEFASEKDMRAWFFEKKVYENQLMAKREVKDEKNAQFEEDVLKRKAARQRAKDKLWATRKAGFERFTEAVAAPIKQFGKKVNDPETYSWFWETKQKVTPKIDWLRRRKDKGKLEENSENERVLRNEEAFSMDSE